MHKITVSVLAIFLAGAWTVVPVAADSQVKDKAERAGEKIENKAERAEDKGDSAMDKLKAKTRDVKDELKAKTERAKDKLEAKTDKLEAKTERADVKATQQALRDRGHDPGPIDGVHGPRTSAALKKFQQAEGLTASGQLDEETMHRLNVPSASPATEPTVPATPAPGAPPVQQRQSR